MHCKKCHHAAPGGPQQRLHVQPRHSDGPRCRRATLPAARPVCAARLHGQAAHIRLRRRPAVMAAGPHSQAGTGNPAAPPAWRCRRPNHTPGPPHLMVGRTNHKQGPPHLVPHAGVSTLAVGASCKCAASHGDVPALQASHTCQLPCRCARQHNKRASHTHCYQPP